MKQNRPPKGMSAAQFNRMQEERWDEMEYERNNYRARRPRFNVRGIFAIFLFLAILYVLIGGYLQPIP